MLRANQLLIRVARAGNMLAMLHQPRDLICGHLCGISQRLDSERQNKARVGCAQRERGCAGPESQVSIKWRDITGRRRETERERERRLPVVHLRARQYAFEPVAPGWRGRGERPTPLKRARRCDTMRLALLLASPPI